MTTIIFFIKKRLHDGVRVKLPIRKSTEEEHVGGRQL